MTALQAKVLFGEFELDLASGELRRGGQRLALQDLPFRVLGQLVTHPGEVVSREALTAHLWPGQTFIDTDVGLNTAVRKLRAVLGDDSDAPRYIETLPRRGYRLLVPVAVAPEPGEATTGPSGAPPAGLADRTSRRVKLAAVAVIIAAITAMVAMGVRQHLQSVAGPRTIAVLPLANLSRDPAQQYFADGMTDALITELGRERRLRVISRTTMQRYRATTSSLREIAGELDADVLVEGAVLRSGDRVRITAQLIDADDTHLWAQSYDGDLRDVLKLQRTIAGEIARHVVAEVAESPGTAVPGQDTRVNPAAYDAYLVGRFHLAKFNGDKAASYFERAIAIDPGYAAPHAGLADAYVLLGANALMPMDEAMPKARAAAQRALELDPAQASAHGALGLILQSYDWNWKEAEAQYRRALELNPGDVEVHLRYAWMLRLLRRPEESLAETRKAIELDPLSARAYTLLCSHQMLANQLDAAVASCRHAVELDETLLLAAIGLSEAYRAKGMYKEWAEEWQRNVLVRGDKEQAQLVARVFAREGGAGLERLAARNMEAQCKADSGMPGEVCAAFHAQAGDLDTAFRELERAFEHHSPFLPAVDLDPRAAALRADKRYAAFRERLNLPDP
jgi:TolB-like protein/DNA-binding winged helix-turn-helix (wHTH) protein/Tfp pilus assembly protein PilF